MNKIKDFIIRHKMTLVVLFGLALGIGIGYVAFHKGGSGATASSENKISTRRTPAESVALRRTHVPKSRKAPVIQDGERSLVIKHRQCAADGLNYQ